MAMSGTRVKTRLAPKLPGTYAPVVSECDCRQTKMYSGNVIVPPNVAPTNPNVSSNIRIANILQRTKGGRPHMVTEEEASIAVLKINHLGRTYGQAGGSGEPIRNRFL